MTTLSVLIVLATLATVAALVTGVGSMIHGGRFDRAHSMQFMGARVGLQLLTVLLVLLAVFLTTV